MMSPAKPIRSVLPGSRGGKNSDGLLHPTVGGGAVNYQPTMLAGTYNSIATSISSLTRNIVAAYNCPCHIDIPGYTLD